MKKTEPPDYKRIYEDILRLEHPAKKEQCKSILCKKAFSVNDVIAINNIIFPNADKKTENINQRHRSYDKAAILEILDYQKKNQLTTAQLSRYFKLSRNSIVKWKKWFSI
ncbi:Uncharacterised protein [Chryseobacterium gleum]|uniref:Transposase n=2 Tax=Chryseobacterium gleum TaxID=250 RepID=A0A3S4M4S6_CHRGE|nr:hypothetical protein [Chryseobacterium gleum]EFK34284.1 hypothetical protein HMPREF0204_13353 [Chryseobacterium gleum ATCC 35910]QQY30150.1 helix-turn-helix domain-containing protein [Chryseobacterium gleum]VEE05539.1 Uncharacterised protein [Chryseobacterium gleum]